MVRHPRSRPRPRPHRRRSPRGIKRLREQGDPLAEAFDAAKARADRWARSSAPPATTPCSAAATSTSTPSSSNAPCASSNPTASSACSPPPASTPTAPPPASSSPSPPPAASPASTTSRTAASEPTSRPSSRHRLPLQVLRPHRRRAPTHVPRDPLRLLPTRHRHHQRPRPRLHPESPDDFARVNPNTGTAPVFRTRRDADLTRRIYQNHPVLVDRSGDDERRVWPVRYVRMLDMTNDSHLFRTAAQLEDDGFYPVQGNRWKRGKDLYLPLYQGRMIQHFDHRASSVRVNPESTHNPYLSEQASDAQHSDPNFLPRSQYWVPASEVASKFPKCGYALSFRDIARPTDVRTIISTVVPQAGYGNKVPLLFEDARALDEDDTTDGDALAFDASGLACLAANLNSMCLDFVARQKVQGTTLNLYILEQLPLIAPDAYHRHFGDRTAADLVRDHVLRLTYNSHDMAPFARDLGHHGPPFPWNEEDRRHLRARLDALYFHLYGLTRDDAHYILSTFPIIQRQDQAQFGHYRTKALILAYMNALGAGDTDAMVNV